MSEDSPSTPSSTPAAKAPLLSFSPPRVKLAGTAESPRLKLSMRKRHISMYEIVSTRKSGASLSHRSISLSASLSPGRRSRSRAPSGTRRPVSNLLRLKINEDGSLHQDHASSQPTHLSIVAPLVLFQWKKTIPSSLSSVQVPSLLPPPSAKDTMPLPSLWPRRKNPTKVSPFG